MEAAENASRDIIFPMIKSVFLSNPVAFIKSTNALIVITPSVSIKLEENVSFRAVQNRAFTGA